MADVPDPAAALPLLQTQFPTTPGGDRVSDPDPIVAFLTERLDDDEQVALHVGPEQGGWSLDLLDGDWHIAISARRVLADVEAKRAIVESAGLVLRAVPSDPNDYTLVDSVEGEKQSWLHDVLIPLARVWSDHPDFDPSWAS